MFYTYVIKSLKDNRYYIGYTNDLTRRVEDHNRGKSASLRNRGPFVLVHQEIFETRQEAQERERTIKRYKGGEDFKKLFSQKPCDPIV